MAKTSGFIFYYDKTEHNKRGDIVKIKVILTGGTIGSENRGGVIYDNAEKDIVDFYQSKTQSDIVFEKFYPYNILSENISIENWNSLIEELKKDNTCYDGIIITHGSDTLSYTSAMVSLFCKNTRVPVVLTGADKVLSDPLSNGLENFATAVSLIRDKRIGVWTSFSGIFSASCIMEADCFTDRFRRGGMPEDYKEDFAGVFIADNKNFPENFHFKNRVKIIKEYPFADYSNVVIKEEEKAVLLVGYHSGTANENTVKTLLHKCKEKNIKLYLQGQKTNGGMYSSTDSLAKQGVNILYDMTPEFAFAYLMFMVQDF